MQHRNFKRIDITLPPGLVTALDQYQESHGFKRSTIIQLALREWFDKRAPFQQAGGSVVGTATGLINGKVFDPEKDFMDYIEPGMSEETMVRVLEEFEAAQQRRYTKE